jgi:beta-mannosidase
MSELAVRWVAEKSWTYWTIFPSPAGDGHAHAARTDLVFKGLDTFATVTLNGTKILEADNMFLEYRVDVTKLLKEPQDNVLEIVFDSALLRGRELVKEHEHEHRIIAHQTEASRLPVRKAQCHWGWDWGPILITAGPWRPVLLETYVCRIDDVWFQAQASSNLKWVSGKLYARADIGGKGKEDVVIKFSLLYDGREVFQSQGTLDDECIASTEFHIQDPVLWYPHGYGTQARYVLHATLVQAGSAELATKSKLVGFRRCQLVQEQDNFGKSFYFRVNNVDIFAGGSCWIPADSFLPRIGPENYKKWMELMVEGNQIMIR